LPEEVWEEDDRLTIGKPVDPLAGDDASHFDAYYTPLLN